MLRHADGFGLLWTQADFERSYLVSSYSQVVLRSAGRFGGKCLRVNNGLLTFSKDFLAGPSQTRCIVGFAFKCKDPLFGTVICAIQTVNGSSNFVTVKVVYAREPNQNTLETWFKIAFYDAADKKIGECKTLFRQNQQYYFEVWLFPDSSAGIFQFRVNNILEFAIFGGDTRFGTGSTTWRRVYWSLAGDTIFQGWMEMDDLYVCDGASPEYGQSDFQGDLCVSEHYPAEDVTNQWTPVGGDVFNPHYQFIDDGATGVFTDTDRLEMDVVSGPKFEIFKHLLGDRLEGGEVLGAMVELDCVLDGAGTVNLRPAHGSFMGLPTSVNWTSARRIQLPLPYALTRGKQFSPETVISEGVGFGVQ